MPEVFACLSIVVHCFLMSVCCVLQYMVSLLRQVIFLELVQLLPGKISVENNILKEITAAEMDNDEEDVMDVDGLANDKTLTGFVYHKLFFVD